MSFVKIRFVNTSTANFTNNTVYDVVGWGADGSTAIAIVVDDTGAIKPVQASNTTDWAPVSVVTLEPKMLV